MAQIDKISVNNVEYDIGGIAVPQTANALPASNTALTANTIYSPTSTLGTYVFKPPTTGNKWAHGKFTTGASVNISFGGQFLGAAPTIKANTTYEFDVYDSTWIVQEVKIFIISKLPLGALINVGTDGGNGAANYEIADINNLFPGRVVLVRKNIYSNSQFGSYGQYPNATLDNLIKTTIYNKMPQQLRNKMMDVTFQLSGSGNTTRTMFAPTYTMAGFGNNYGIAEGKALQLYTSNASRIKKLNGSASDWWLSSQYSADMARYVAASGSTLNGNPSHSYGVVPAFVISSKTPYDLTPNTDGSYNLIL